MLAFLVLAAATPMTPTTLEVAGNVRWLSSGDLNGDGWTDLVVSYTRGSGPQASRYLAVFIGTEQGYPKRPTKAVRAPRSAAAYDLGDALAGPEDELIFFEHNRRVCPALCAG